MDPLMMVLLIASIFIPQIISDYLRRRSRLKSQQKAMAEAEERKAIQEERRARRRARASREAQDGDGAERLGMALDDDDDFDDEFDDDFYDDDDETMDGADNRDRRALAAGQESKQQEAEAAPLDLEDRGIYDERLDEEDSFGELSKKRIAMEEDAAVEAALNWENASNTQEGVDLDQIDDWFWEDREGHEDQQDLDDLDV